MYRILLTAALVAALLSLAGIWLDGRLREGRRQEQADFELRLEQELDKLISLEEIAGSDRKILNVLRHVAGQVDVPVVLYRDKLVDELDTDRLEISVPRTKLSLRNVLGLLSHQVPIGYYTDHGRLVITTSEDAGSFILTRIYPLPRLAGPERPFDADSDGWIELVTREVEPDSWDDVGGPGEVIPIPGALVIRQSWQNHERLKQFFRQLQQVTPHLDAQADFLASYSPAEREILTALEVPCDFQCAGVSLLEVLNELSSRQHIPIALCQTTLEAAAIDLKMPLTLKMKGATLCAVLHSLLEPLDLSYVISDGVLQVTTPEDTGSRMRTVVYDVGDLVIEKRGTDFDSLIELITTTIDPDSWDDHSGPGPFQELLPGWLAFSQTDHMHAETAHLLTQIRAMLRHRSGGPPPLVVKTPVEKKIAAALEREVKLEYQGQTLQQIASDLAVRTGINVRLDKKRLVETSVLADTPISCHLPTLPLKFAIRRLLEDENLAEARLAWTIRDECLVLTNRGYANEEREVLVLDVRGLVGPGEDRETFDEDYLTELLETAFQSDVQKLGDHCHFYKSLLVVVAPREVNAKVQKLVEALERFRDASLLARQKGTLQIEAFSIDLAEPNYAPDALLVRVYPVEDLLGSEGPLAMDELRVAITDIVLEDTWSDMGGAGEIVAVPPGGLLIFQTSEGHRQVQKLLDELRQHLVPSLPLPSWLVDRDKSSRELEQALSSREPSLSGLTRISELQRALRWALKRDVALDEEFLRFHSWDLLSFREETPWEVNRPTIKEQLAGLGLAVVQTEQGCKLTSVAAVERLAFYDVRDLLSRKVPFEVDELSGIVESGLVADASSGESNGPTAYFHGWLIIRSREQRLEMLEKLLAWLRQQPEVPRAREVHQRQDAAETGELVRRLLDSKSAEEQLYLAFVLQFAAPPEDGLEELAARSQSLADSPNSLVALRLRDVMHRWVVTLPNERLEKLFDTSHSPLLRKAAIQTLASRVDARKSGFDTVLEAVESRISTRPGLSSKEIAELRLAVEQRFLPPVHRTNFDNLFFLNLNPTSKPRSTSSSSPLRIPPWRQPRRGRM